MNFFFLIKYNYYYYNKYEITLYENKRARHRRDIWLHLWGEGLDMIKICLKSFEYFLQLNVLSVIERLQSSEGLYNVLGG